MEKKRIYTVGYSLFQKGSSFDLYGMFQTLHMFGLTYLIDVRSVPYSKQYPMCNAENLKSFGRSFALSYMHMPELGAKASPEQDVFTKAIDIFFEESVFPLSKSNRPEKTELKKDDEIVDFNKFRESENLLDGLKRIEKAYNRGYTLALMCSEKNPMDCHRYFLISKMIEQKFGEWLAVEHIIKGNNDEIITITNEALDAELIKYIINKEDIRKMNIFESSFFGDAKIDNYYGDSRQAKIADFCDRYWNLLHGWKKILNDNIKYNDYD